MNREQYVEEVRDSVIALRDEFLKEEPSLTAVEVWRILMAVDNLKNTLRVSWEGKRP